MTTTSLPDIGEGIIITDKPGMDNTGKCYTCDCRYCGHRCHAAAGTQYVVRVGYRTKEVAARWAEAGFECRDGDEGWIEVDNPKPTKKPMRVKDVELRVFELMAAKKCAVDLDMPSDIIDRFEAAIVECTDLLELAYTTPEGQ